MTRLPKIVAIRVAPLEPQAGWMAVRCLGGRAKWLLNYFHASLKLERKERIQGRLQRIYGAAQTPLARVLLSAEVSPQTKRRLAQAKSRLNPFALKRDVERALKDIASQRRAQP